MAVDDHGWEVLKKSGEEVIPGDKSDHIIKTRVDPEPTRRIVHEALMFEDSGGSPDMDVNGSSTPVIFTIEPRAGEIWFLENVSILFNDNGIFSPGGFGSGGELSNGVLIEQFIDGTNHTFLNFTKNSELWLNFSTTNAVSGFQGSANLFVGSHNVEPEVTLKESTSDLLRVTVRDNLSGISNLNMSAVIWRFV